MKIQICLPSWTTTLGVWMNTIWNQGGRKTWRPVLGRHWPTYIISYYAQDLRPPSNMYFRGSSYTQTVFAVLRQSKTIGVRRLKTPRKAPQKNFFRKFYSNPYLVTCIKTLCISFRFAWFYEENRIIPINNAASCQGKARFYAVFSSFRPIDKARNML